VDTRRLSDPSEFLAAAGPLLVADEARHNLILGLAGTLRDRPGYYSEFRLWCVEDDGEVVAAALQTPPLNVIVAEPAEPQALVALADTTAAEGIDLPGVVGAPPEADHFADAWESRSGTSRRLRRSSRIYRLDAVRPVANVAGRPRVATHEDRQLLVEWLDAFNAEALEGVPSPLAESERMVDIRLRGPDSGFLLWVDDAPVSMAGWGSPTPSGIRVGPVYTPPPARRRGYGSAVTAAVSSDQLASGRRFCFLYTDLANPTSNKIYVDIGYEPVCDSVDYAFEHSP